MFDGVLGLLKWVKSGLPIVAALALGAGYLYVDHLKSEISSCHLDLDIAYSTIETKEFECEQSIRYEKAKEKIDEVKSIDDDVGAVRIDL